MKSIGEILNNPDDLALARHIAERLNDRSSLTYYLMMAQSYPHDLILEILESVMQIPEAKITTRRAAIFVANMKRYESTR